LLSKTLGIMYVWGLISISYGISTYKIMEFVENIYTETLILGVVELIAYIMSAYFSINF